MPTSTRLEGFHDLAVAALATIAGGKRKTREQRYAQATLSFLDSLGDAAAIQANRGWESDAPIPHDVAQARLREANDVKIRALEGEV